MEVGHGVTKVRWRDAFFHLLLLFHSSVLEPNLHLCHMDNNDDNNYNDNNNDIDDDNNNKY